MIDFTVRIGVVIDMETLGGVVIDGCIFEKCEECSACMLETTICAKYWDN